MKFLIGNIKIDTRDRRVWLAGVLALAVIIFVSIYMFGSSEDIGANVAIVTRGDFNSEIYESGEVRAVNSINLDAPHEWRMDLQIVEMVKEGTIVSKGDTLVRFDQSQLEDQLTQAIDELKAQEAEVLSTEAQQKSQMSQLDSDLLMAEYSLEATELELEQLKYESESRREEARLSHEMEKISYDETQTNISTQGIINAAEIGQVNQVLFHRKMWVDDLYKRIEALTITAPGPGMVVYNEIGGWGQPRHKVTVGETIRPGVTVVSIPDLSEMECVLRVNEIDASKIRRGQSVTLRLDAYMSNVFSGTVKSVAPLADRAEAGSQIKDFEVLVEIDQANNMLKPGMTAKARIVTETITDVLAVPIGSVYEKDGNPVVFTTSSYPDPIPVKLGQRNDQYIIITEGINEGDQILLAVELDNIHALGWYADRQRKEEEKHILLGHIGEMEELGVGDDVPKVKTTNGQPPEEQIIQRGGQGGEGAPRSRPDNR